MLERLEFVLIACLALAGESAITVAFTQGSWEKAPVLAAHVALSLLLGLWAWLRPWRDNRFPVTVAVSTMLMGVFGTAGTLLAFFAWLVSPHRHGDKSDWYRLLFPENKVSLTQRIYQQMVLERRSRPHREVPDVAPMVDVLDKGSLDQKVEIVAYLARHYRPRFAAALRRALRDEEPSIRVQAAAIAARVDSLHTARIDKLEEQRRRAPDDVAVMRNLAREYDNYAHGALLPAATRDEFRRKAITLFESVLATDEADAGVRLELVRLLVRCGRYDDALDLVRDEDLDPERATPRMLPWLLEALYRGGRYADLHRLAKALRGKLDANEFPVAVIQALSVWEEGDHAGQIY